MIEHNLETIQMALVRGLLLIKDLHNQPGQLVVVWEHSVGYTDVPQKY